ncbi:MAG: NAD-dependent succinate-semialdehyde dehydrogenase [Alphaproteobacteria bacterium]
MQTSINPATGEILKEYPVHSPAEADAIVAQAHNCFLSWRRTSFEERAKHLYKVSDVIVKHKDEYALLAAKEMGKTIKEGIAELDKCASTAKFFADNAHIFLADQHVKTEYQKSYVTFQPLGVILGVMPWNFPFWQVLRFVIPSLMAGNTCLLKHASNVPGCAMAIESIIREAGLPEGTFRTLLIPGSRVDAIIADPRISAVTLTGSTPVGRSVAATAGKYLKKTVLELGGSDPYLILHDADIEHAIKTCAASRMVNCGQSCVSAKRLIVVESLKERFEQGVKDVFSKQVMGDPTDPKTTVGPMSRADLRDEIHDQVTRTVKQGAKLVLGGTVPDTKTAFYPLTILSDVKKGMAAYEEELFGPVAIIIPAKDEEDAIRIANDTVFGLGGAVFSTDIARAEKIARERVESGACFVNMMVRSDARLPFGGVKDSGYGRELSAFGIREFTNTKTIVVA